MMKNKREVRELAAAIFVRLPKVPVTQESMPGVDMYIHLSIAHAERFYEILEKHLEEPRDER